jgi:hypothetical protein
VAFKQPAFSSETFLQKRKIPNLSCEHRTAIFTKLPLTADNSPSSSGKGNLKNKMF